jgi:hypothetical protein
MPLSQRALSEERVLSLGVTALHEQEFAFVEKLETTLSICLPEQYSRPGSPRGSMAARK